MPGPGKLDLGDLDLHLADHASRRLDDPELPDPTLLKRSLERDVSIVRDDLSFTVGGEAVVDVFNAPGDEDPAEVFGPPPDHPARSTTFEFRPPIHFAADSAWLAYRASARVEAKGGFKAAKFGFAGEADGAASILFHDYRRHGAEDLVGPSVARDLATPRFVISAADVRALSPGEALALEVNGKLAAALTLKWSDVFTGNIAALSGLLAPGEDLGVKVGASLRASFKVEIEDHFLVVFSRREPGEIRVAVRKSDRDRLRVRAAARISVRFADRAQTEEALRAAVEALLAEPLERVREILAKPGVGDLDPRERAAAERLVDRLGIEGRRLRLDSLRKKVERLERDAAELIVKMAKQQVRFGVDFDYSRTRTEEAIIEATFDEERLGGRFDALHRAMLGGDFKKVLEDGASAAATGVTLHRFLQQETVKRTKSWGVSLELGDFLRMGGKARSYVRETMRRDRRLDRSRFSFTALDGYVGSWGGETCEWKTTLTAKSRDWTPREAPAADALDYSLGFLVRHEKPRLSSRDAGRLVDLAVLWGSVTAGGAPEARARLERVAGSRGDVKVSFQLGFRKSTFDTLLALLARGDARGIGLALARAVPGVAGEPGRDTPIVRQLLYGDPWREYLEDRTLSAGELAAAAAEAARRAGHAGLAGFERRMRHWWTVGDLARKNGETRERWADLARGAARLRDAISGGGPHTEVREAARLLSRGWEHAFHQRALGVYLVEAVRAHPHLWGAVNRSLRVEYREGEERVVLNLGST
ncbi:MAG: hypothetical protein F4164_02470 [Gemmatimonadales bacterium]|nr:hypothetical protein [Gemmatimonadales bacterium]MYG48239.1 hypothetical protein [Gemmatimonadales bacterium]MYK02775.1 hypothetical protein [Candidatus Palauibacter ramosifaciens]